MKGKVRPEAPRKQRALRSDELAIWSQVKRTVTPLVPETNAYTAGFGEAAVSKATSEVAAGKPKPAERPFAIFQPAPLPAAPRPPAIAGLNRRDTQKLARGNVDIDGRIDLHGMSVERARLALLTFIENSRAGGKRNVLVITGKGASPFTRHTLHSTSVYHAPEREGRIRAEFSRWMHERIFADHVIGFQPAHPRHGGGGAF